MATAAILGFHIFAVFVKNSNLRSLLRWHANFGKDRTIRGRVIACFRFSKWRPSAILVFGLMPPPVRGGAWKSSS